MRDSFAYGYSVGEFTVKNVGGQWLLSSVQILDPTSVQFQMTQNEDKSYGIGYVIQKAGMEDVKIPAGKKHPLRQEFIAKMLSLVELEEGNPKIMGSMS